MAGFMNSVGLYDHTDQIANSNINFRRINFRANADIDVTRRLSFLFNLGGRIEDRMYPTTGTATFWQNMATYSPNLYPVRTQSGQITGTATFPDNPVGSLLEKGWSSLHTRDVQATVTVKEKLDFVADGLNAFATVSLNSNYMNAYSKSRSYAYYEPVKTLDIEGNDSIYYLRRGNDTDLSVSVGGDAEINRTVTQAGFEYDQMFGQQAVSALLMFRQEKQYIFGQQSAYAKRNFLGRVNYALQQKYIAEFSFSYSGTDNFKKGERFGFFPALSVGWILSNENFLSGSEVVDFLKLRASAGLLGSDAGAKSFRYNYNQYWGTSGAQGDYFVNNQAYYFGTGTTEYGALVQLGLANPRFTWEKAMLYNVGVETEFLNERLTFAVDYFFENRSDILVNVNNTVPGISGIAFATNVSRGKTQNQGVELAAQYRDGSGDLAYFIGGNFSFARNKILESFETPRKDERRMTQGKPIGQRFGLEAIGFFKDNSDIEKSALHTFYPVRPGDLKYKDQNGDGIIDDNDIIAIRNPSAPEICFALNMGISWKGFDVELMFDGNTNRSVNMNGYMFWPFINNNNISPWTTERRWTPENAGDAAAPRLTTQSNPNNYRNSDFWIRDISLVRLRNAELGYNFSGDFLRKARIDKIRLYVSGLNLFTLSNLDADVDPETLSFGYPTLRTWSVGINVNF
jgi:TonB-linked SusC/RagA family outer membrane protein